MRRSDRLMVVLQMEERREAAAQEAMQAALHKYEGERGRLQELLQYHGDYQNQIRQQQGPQSSQRLLGWQQFISQLNQAIEQQQGQVNRLQARLEEARKLWRAAWEKRQAMARHIEDCRRQEQQDTDQREQKLVDEATNLRFARGGRR
jgi:flagellar FliJ protein